MAGGINPAGHLHLPPQREKAAVSHELQPETGPQLFEIYVTVAVLVSL
jgi:hypothetical protein